MNKTIFILNLFFIFFFLFCIHSVEKITKLINSNLDSASQKQITSLKKSELRDLVTQENISSLTVAINNLKKNTNYPYIRKARIIKLLKAIKATLPKRGNPLPECRKHPTPAELWVIAAAIIDSADMYDIPASLITAVIRRESLFCNQATSRVGAKGYMQLMPQTARETSKSLYLKNGKHLTVYKKRDNILLGSAYLSEMILFFNRDVSLAVKAYNGGPNHVLSVINKKRSNYYQETKEYEISVLSYHEDYKKMGIN